MKSAIDGQGASAITPAAPYLTAKDYYNAQMLPYQQESSAAVTRYNNLRGDELASSNSLSSYKNADQLNLLQKTKQEMILREQMKKQGMIADDEEGAAGVPPAAMAPVVSQEPGDVVGMEGPGVQGTVAPMPPVISREPGDVVGMNGPGFAPQAPSVASAIAPAGVSAQRIKIESAEEIPTLPIGTRFILNGKKQRRI